MKKILALLMCLGMLTGAASCAKHDKKSGGIDNSDSAAETSADTSAADDIYSPKNYRLDEFDDSLIAYLCLNGYNSSNFLVSPASFRAALSLAAVGAQGSTRTELLNAAGFSGMDALKAWYSSLDPAAVNSVWSSEDLLGEFSAAYVSKINENYNADAISCKSGELTKAVNDWISRNTDGMISSVADDLSGASTVLISTLNLQSAWQNAFLEASVSEGIFVGNDGKEQKTYFMKQTGEYLYAEENGVKVLVLPMENNMSFVCFLGNRTGRFDKMTGVHMEKVHVVLPKFELVSAFDSKDFSGFLLQRGINDAISSRTANFYNMCSGSDWFIQEMIQKLRISLSEDGLGASPDAAPPEGYPVLEEGEEVKEFIADEPFSFAVFSGFGTESQHMLLYGQLMDISQSFLS